MSRKRRAADALSGGDLLTWALILGVGGFAAWKGYGELQELRAVKAPTSAAPTTTPTPTAPAVVAVTPGGAVVAPTTGVTVGGTAPTPIPAPVPAAPSGGTMWAGGTPPWVFNEAGPILAAPTLPAAQVAVQPAPQPVMQTTAPVPTTSLVSTLTDAGALQTAQSLLQRMQSSGGLLFRTPITRPVMLPEIQ